MSDVFLSYAKEDRERIIPLVRALESKGLQVFWDRVIPPGKDWRSFIGAEIADAKCVVVAWSKTSVDSRWVKEEAEHADGKGRLVPILIDEVEPPLGFGTIQAADLSRWDGSTVSQTFNYLFNGIRALIEPSSSQHSSAVPPATADLQRRVEEERRLRQQAESRAEEERRLRQAAVASNATVQPISGAWWLLPVFLAWIGGLIAYLVLKDKNKKTATNMLILGIVVTIITFVLYFLVYACSSSTLDSGY